jgi:hypothetical protein
MKGIGIAFATLLLIGCGELPEDDTTEVTAAVTYTEEFSDVFNPSLYGEEQPILGTKFRFVESGNSHLFNTITFSYSNRYGTTQAQIESTQIALNCSGLYSHWKMPAYERIVIAPGSSFTKAFTCALPATSWDLTATVSF